MSRHRNMRAEVEGSEYYEDQTWEDDNYEDDFIERRIDMNDGWHYTKDEFIECYGGTFQWDAAKVWKHPATKRAEEKAAKKAKDKAKNSDAAASSNAAAQQNSRAATAAAAAAAAPAVAPASAQAPSSACGTCTFVNAAYRTKCEMCDTPLVQPAASPRPSITDAAAATSTSVALSQLHVTESASNASPAPAQPPPPLVPLPPAPVLSLDAPGLKGDPRVEAALEWASVEDASFVARELTAEGVDLDLLLDASRDDLLELGMHPRSIDCFHGALAAKPDSREEVLAVAAVAEAAAAASAAAEATTNSNAGGGGAEGGGGGARVSTLTSAANTTAAASSFSKERAAQPTPAATAAAASSNRSTASGTPSSGSGSLSGEAAVEAALLLKDRSWCRPQRPTAAEAASLATGGGLYGGSGAAASSGGEDLANQRTALSMVVVGHVDAGKSTLMGQLLVATGAVPSRTLHKHKQEAAAMGKASFYLAWVMDEDTSERAHGVTIDVAQKKFTTPTKEVTVLDSPGHADFVPRMIAGAVAADVGLLVVAAPEGEFEAGFGGGGQTKEHAMLLKSLGVTQVLVAINKMDATSPPFSRARFDEIASQLKEYLVAVCKFKASKVRILPVAAFSGDNVAVCDAASPLHMWTSEADEDGCGSGDFPTLVSAIDSFEAIGRPTVKPLRILISDVAPSSRNVLVSGQVVSGSVDVGQPLLLRPANDRAVVKALYGLASASSGTSSGSSGSGSSGAPKAYAEAGDGVSMLLEGLQDASRVKVGDVLCSLVSPPPAAAEEGEEKSGGKEGEARGSQMVAQGGEVPVPVARRIAARVTTFDSLAVPFIKGAQVTLHLGQSEVAANVIHLVSLLDSKGEVRSHKPRAISSGCGAVVHLRFEKPLCVETHADCKALGRFVLRQRGATVAAGLVTEIL